MSHSNTNTNHNTNCTTIKMYWLYAGPSCDVSIGYLQDNANQQPTNGSYYTFLGPCQQNGDWCGWWVWFIRQYESSVTVRVREL